MADNVYQMIELVGTSTKSIEDAVSNALSSRAGKKSRNLRWFEVVQTRGAIKEGKVMEWQVTLKVGEKLGE